MGKLYVTAHARVVSEFFYKFSAIRFVYFGYCCLGLSGGFWPISLPLFQGAFLASISDSLGVNRSFI